MSKLTKLADRLLNKVAPKAEADAACIWIYTMYYPGGLWCQYYDNCPQKCNF